MEFKINIGCSKDKKTYKKVLKDDACNALIGQQIGSVVNGELFDLPGYELEITGGSDYCGFPMRKDVSGIARKKILIVSGIGIRNKRKNGTRYKKNVAGNEIYEKTAQINFKVKKYGPNPIEKPVEEVKEAPATE